MLFSFIAFNCHHLQAQKKSCQISALSYLKLVKKNVQKVKIRHIIPSWTLHVLEASLWLRGAGLQHQKCDSKRKWEKKSHLILFTNTHTHTNGSPCAFCNACLSSYFTPIIFLVKIKGREWWYHIFSFTTVPKETRFNDILCHEDV